MVLPKHGGSENNSPNFGQFRRPSAFQASRPVTQPEGRLDRNRQPECVKSTRPVALHFRPVFCAVFRRLKNERRACLNSRGFKAVPSAPSAKKFEIHRKRILRIALPHG
jgi:hypothetical protein